MLWNFYNADLVREIMKLNDSMSGFRSCQNHPYMTSQRAMEVFFVWRLKMHHKTWNVGWEVGGNLQLCMASLLTSPTNEVFIVELDSSEFFQVSTGFHCIGCKTAFAFESIFAEDRRFPDFSHSYHISNQVNVGRSNPSWGTLFNTTIVLRYEYTLDLGGNY